MDFSGALQLLKNITDEVDEALGQVKVQREEDRYDNEHVQDIVIDGKEDAKNIQTTASTLFSGNKTENDEKHNFDVQDIHEYKAWGGNSLKEFSSTIFVHPQVNRGEGEIGQNNNGIDELRSQKEEEQHNIEIKEMNSIRETDATELSVELEKSEDLQTTQAREKIDETIFTSNKSESNITTAESFENELERVNRINDALGKKVEVLSRRLAECEDARDSACATADSLREKLSTTERKVFALGKDRSYVYDAKMQEKDDTIKQIMEEGEALSIKQAEYEKTIKTLRAKLRQSETDIERLNEALGAEQSKSANLEEQRSKDQAEKTKLIDLHKSELVKQEKKFEDLIEKSRKEIQSAETRVGQEAALRNSVVLKETSAKEEVFNETVSGLRNAITLQEEQSAMKEQLLRKTIEEQKSQLRESEARFDELSSRLPNATRPLMRQLEAMHKQMEESTASWAATERSLMRRLQESQAAAATAIERERLLQDERAEEVAGVAAGEAQKELLKREIQSLQNRIRRSEKTEESMRAEKEEQGKLMQEVKSKNEKIVATCEELEIKIDNLETQLREKNEFVERCERECFELKETISTLKIDLKDEISKSQKLSNKVYVNNLESKIADSTPSQDTENGLSQSEIDVTFLSTNNHSKSAFDNDALRAEIRRKNGELLSTRDRITDLEKTTSRLAEELLAAATKQEELASSRESLARLSWQYKELEQRHLSALVRI